MITATHMLVGGALGSLVGPPPLALALGVASHLPLDLVPHFDLDLRRDVVLAAAVGVAVTGIALARGGGGPTLYWGMAGGILPDLENLLWHLGLTREEHRYFPGHGRGWPRHGSVRGPANLLVQAVLSMGALVVIFR